MPMNIDRAVRLVRNGVDAQILGDHADHDSRPPVDRQSAFASGGELRVVRDEDECDPEFTNMSEQYVGDHVAGFGVERAGWLVADQQIGIARPALGRWPRAAVRLPTGATACCTPSGSRADGVQHARGSSSG